MNILPLSYKYKILKHIVVKDQNPLHVQNNIFSIQFIYNNISNNITRIDRDFT